MDYRLFSRDELQINRGTYKGVGRPRVADYVISSNREKTDRTKALTGAKRQTGSIVRGGKDHSMLILYGYFLFAIGYVLATI